MTPKRFAAALALALCLAAALLAPAWAGPIVRGPALDKAEVARILAGHEAKVVQGKPFLVVDKRHGQLWVEPAIDPALQAKAQGYIAKSKDHAAAVVVMDAHTGRVVALAGVRRGKTAPGVALDGGAPAASLFKMVTAAALFQELGWSPDSEVCFIGRPHTLYRYQVRQKFRWRPTKVSLESCFARSNNPAFARLGIFELGQEALTRQARLLGFGGAPAFELPVKPGQLTCPTNDFQVGEMACGFNRVTSTSPLHAAQMVAAFVGNGRLPEPWVISRIVTPDGRVLYRGHPRLGSQVASQETCRHMREVMAATVRKGTARDEFRRLHRDRVLRTLEMGGKTGTLRGASRRLLYEWFAGYGRDPRNGRAYALCALAVHKKLRYTNPKRLARQMLREAFRARRVAERQPAPEPSEAQARILPGG